MGHVYRQGRKKSADLLNRESLAWAAGLADGEGSFVVVRRVGVKSGHLPQPTFAIGQVDRQVLDRFQSATGFGKVYGPYLAYGKGREKHRAVYQLHVYGFEQVQALTAMLWPWLGQVKRQQAKAKLQGE